MHFLSLSSLLVGLAFSALVQSAPSTYGQRAELMPRGLPDSAYRLHYMPRGMERRAKKGGGKNDKNNNQEIDIEVIDISEKIKVGKEEIDLEVKVTEILLKSKGNNDKKDNKRKDVAKSSHPKKNVVIQVVQVIIDIRDGKKTRYAMHALTADNSKNATTTVMVTDAQTMTISNKTLCSSNNTVAAGQTGFVVADATATASAAIAAATADVGAPYLMSNQTMIYPPGSAAPVALVDVTVVEDPAKDLVTAIIAADVDGTCV